VRGKVTWERDGGTGVRNGVEGGESNLGTDEECLA